MAEVTIRERHRRGQHQPQIIGQKECRERGHDTAEGKERQERQEQPRQPDANQVVAELGVLRGLPRQPEGAKEQRADHAQADAAEQHAADQVAFLAPARAVARMSVMLGVSLTMHGNFECCLTQRATIST